MPIKIAFDATLDDIVDAGMRFSKQSVSLRRARINAIAVVGFMSAGGVLAGVLFRADRITTFLVVVVGAVAIAFGLIAALVYRLFYDRSSRHRLRQVASEQLAGAASFHCEIELRPEVLWLKQGGTEVSFPWTEALAMHESSDAIELRFKGGLVVARSRAFSADVERRAFVAQAKHLAPNMR